MKQEELQLVIESGSPAQTCQECKHCIGVKFARRYYFCLIQTKTPRSRAMGKKISLQDAACRAFQYRTNPMPVLEKPERKKT